MDIINKKLLKGYLKKIMLNYDIPLGKEIYLIPNFKKLQVIEKCVLNFVQGESVIAYKCKADKGIIWIHKEIIDCIFDIEGDYDGSKNQKTKRKTT